MSARSVSSVPLPHIGSLSPSLRPSDSQHNVAATVGRVPRTVQDFVPRCRNSASDSRTPHDQLYALSAEPTVNVGISFRQPISTQRGLLLPPKAAP